MSKNKAQEATEYYAGQDLMFYTWFGVLFTYSVILIFFAKQMSAQEIQDMQVWVSTLVNAVCISTFTFIFVQAVNNLASCEKKQTAFKCGLAMSGLDIPYILLYGVFEDRPWGLDAFLCVYTAVLIVLAFVSVHLAVKEMKNGQDSQHRMSGSPSGAGAEASEKGGLPT